MHVQFLRPKCRLWKKIFGPRFHNKFDLVKRLMKRRFLGFLIRLLLDPFFFLNYFDQGKVQNPSMVEQNSGFTFWVRPMSRVTKFGSRNTLAYVFGPSNCPE